ncbi:MAG: diaminopimelate epimerase [Lachnospiraceae bacterium]|nr:diaminopimelate epimerase [Lachnospiraceae bacterium]
MRFTKMHGLGNDYVYVNCLKEKVENPAEVSIKVSDRHFGIGSDGLILIKPSDKADFRMDMYNADGSQAEMCGNGIRCVGKYVYDYGLTKKEHISVETLAGIKYLDFTIEDGKVVLVTVDMGEPELKASLIPVLCDQEEAVKEPIAAAGKNWEMTCVSMGNPHCVIFLDQPVKDFPLEQVGPLFENHERFPKRINTEFIEVLDRHTVNMRVWERGSGETMACGTGACASAVAAHLCGYTEEEITLHLLGGDLKVRWDREKNRVYMTGPATVVFDGDIQL